MPKVPRLNQTCTISSITLGSRGQETKSTVASNVPCRFFESSGKIKNNEGEYIEYDAYLHMEADNIVQKGQAITINSKNYKVEYAGHTRDLQGVIFMQFLALKEWSYAN